MNRKVPVVKQIEESERLINYLKGEVETLVSLADLLVQALKNGNKVFLFGNGGSAADAQHIACELAGRFYMDRDPLPVIALTTNTSLLTAIANDYGYDHVFARQISGIVEKGDIVVGISTSGESSNVLLGIAEAKRCGAVTIAFTGQRGRLKDMADHVLLLPSSDTPRLQEAHITAGHIICYLVEEGLFNDGKHL